MGHETSQLACELPCSISPPWVPSPVLDLLNGVRTALGNRGFVCRQTCRKTALAGLSRCADFIDITPAGIHSLPQVVSGCFSLICHFVQSGCTSVTDLVLMRLHAIHEAAFPRRDSAATAADDVSGPPRRVRLRGGPQPPPVCGVPDGADRNAEPVRLMKSCARAAAREHDTASRIYFFSSLSRTCERRSGQPGSRSKPGTACEY